jgi:peptidoglycan/LPS O-acetylase OafA/YrhL
LAQPFLRWIDQHKEFPQLSRYLLHRFKRVLPAFWAQLIIIVIALLVFSKAINWRDVALTALFLQHWVPGSLSIQSHNPVLWSLPVEWWFYATLPLMALVLKHIKWFGFLLISIAVGVGYRYFCYVQLQQAHIDGAFGYASIMHMLARFDQFAIGVLFALAHLRISASSHWRTIASIVGPLVIIALLPQLAARGDIFVSADYPYLYGHYPLFALGWGLLAFGVAGAPHWSNGLLRLPPMQALGTISYSLYLWHYPLLVLLRDRGLDFAKLSHTAVGLVCIVLAAWVSYRCFERPFLHTTR